MSDEVLELTIKHYLNVDLQMDTNSINTKNADKLEKNKGIVETLFMNFDLTMMESSQLLTICLNRELYRSLIHICKEQKDFVTPLMKLCGLRMNKLI